VGFGVRSPGTTAADVDVALSAGLIVRSWPMRATLELLPTTEQHWILDLGTRLLVTRVKTRQAQLGLTVRILEQARQIAVDNLTSGQALTRAEFPAFLEAHDISISQRRGHHTIWFLAQIGTLCWGPMAGHHQALVLLDEWVSTPPQAAA
jgi:hypothetical protein